MSGLLGWLVIIAAGLAWEIIAWRMGDTASWPTLTRVIRTYLPKWAVVGAMAILTFHFLTQR